MKNLFSVEEKLLSLPVVTAKFGAMMARGFVENGARVYITAREIDELEATAAHLNEPAQGYQKKGWQ